MTDQVKGRCGNCMEPYRAHRKRMEAAPCCQSGGVYREATEEELNAAYKATFPDGPEPIATFCADNPADVERARKLFSPEALNGFFGPGGGGMDAFMAAMKQTGAHS